MTSIAVIVIWVACFLCAYPLVKREFQTTLLTWTNGTRLFVIFMCWGGPISLLIGLIFWIAEHCQGYLDKPAKW